MGAIDALHAGEGARRRRRCSRARTRRTCCSRSAPRRRSPRRASPASEQAIAYAVFALIGTVGVAAPVVIYFALGDRSGPILDRLKTWMAQHNAVIMAVLCLVIGAKLVGDAIAGFSA